MTRGEVIKKLKWFREYNEDDFCGGDRIQDEYGDWYYRITEQDFEAFDMAIKALEQEPRKGHWIADVDRWGDLVTTVNGYRCDKCNTFNADKDNYCPNCGADMREVVEE